MPRKAIGVFLLSCLLIIPVMAESKSETQIWESYLGLSRAQAELNIDGNKISGVLEVQESRNGQSRKLTYHFTGQVGNGLITAEHYEGNRFEGRYLAADEIEGTLTTKKGASVILRAKRVQ